MMHFNDHGNMMGNLHGFGLIGIIWMVMWLLIIVGGIFLIVYIIRNNNKRRDSSTSSNALNILKERLARGEIDEHEYTTKKEILERDK